MRTIKSKLTFTSSISSQDKKRIENLCNSAVSGLQIVLGIFKEVAGDTGVPGLKSGVAGLLFVIDTAKRTHQNAQDLKKLTEQIDGLKAVLERSKDGGQLSTGRTLNRIEGLSATWSTIAVQVRKTSSRRITARFIRSADDTQAIGGYIQAITWSIQSFMVETLLAIEFALDEHAIFMKETAIRIEEKIDQGFEQMNARMDIRDGRLPRALFAPFENKIRSQCLEGTRTDILDEIYRWIDSEEAMEQPRIYWISGSAGTGKTTIASTVAMGCRARGLLGASFFCSRDDAECSNVGLILTTIADQLGQYCPSFAAELALILKSKPDIGYSSLPYQLEQLIVNPLHAVGDSLPKSLILVDALDECKDSNATTVFLTTLSRYVAELTPLKFLITSRPEKRVTVPFNSTSLRSKTQQLTLHEVELGVVQQDIELYLSVNLKQIGENYGVEDSWPSVGDIQALTLLSSGLFIFAATASKYIDDRNYSDPRHQLATLLQNTTTAAEGSSSPHRHLDQLYTQVLTQAFPDISGHLAGRLKRVLGTIILLRDPLSSSALEQLLNLKSNTVRETLTHLHSVIIVPDDHVSVIRLLHPSFFDFLTTPNRCRNPNYVVNAQAQHTILARACLNLICSLRRDICDIGDFSLLNNEINGLAERIQKHISPHVQYACRHWAFHLANGMMSEVTLDLVQGFCQEHLLYWIEVCGLLGDLRAALLALDMARKALAAICSPSSTIMTLLYDCERFIREFFPVISVSTLHVYFSALLFTPRRTLLYATYGRELAPVNSWNGANETWSSCIRAMDGHDREVISVAFAADGARISSGDRDGNIRLWDVVSGVRLNAFERRNVSAVGFSPDGNVVALVISNGTILLLDVTNGLLLNTLTGHSRHSVNGTFTVVFSPDGARLASGSTADRAIRLWDTKGGALQNIVRAYSTMFSIPLAFSPDGSLVASESGESSIRLWDALSGRHVMEIKGYSDGVSSFAFSPDGLLLASGNGDGTIFLWDTANGAHLTTFTAQSVVRSVVFSPDGTLLAACNDTAIQFLDVERRRQVKVLQGHTRAVQCFAFSPDGSRLVSGSIDYSVRLWDITSDTSVTQDNPIGGQIYSLAFSSDGTRIASGSFDGTVHLWDTGRGAHLMTFLGNSNCPDSLAISTNNARIASAGTDGRVRVWDVESGTELVNVRRRSPIGSPVGGIAFSSNGALVAFASSDHDIEVYDVTSGAILITLLGFPDMARSLAFSADGQRLVSGTHKGTICLWDAVTGVLLCTVTGSYDAIPALARELLPDQTSLSSPHVDLRPKYVLDGEWIISPARQRHICWIPTIFRPIRSPNFNNFDSRGDCVGIGRTDGRVMVLDFTNLTIP